MSMVALDRWLDAERRTWLALPFVASLAPSKRARALGAGDKA